MRCFSQPWLNSMRYWFNILLYGSPDLSVTAPVIMPALVIVSACSWENLTRKTDWHYVNGVHISLSEGCTASGIQGTDLPPCIPIVRFIDKRFQPLCQPLTAAQFTAWFPVSGLQEEKGLGTLLRFPTPLYSLVFSSVQFQFSHSVVSHFLWPHESQHARPPCPSPTLEFTQTHVHWVSDAIQPSHPLLSPSPPAPNPSQHQSLFQWVNSLHEVAKVLEFQL